MVLTLHESCQHFASSLEERMAHHDLQKFLQPLPSTLDHVITEPVREYFPWQGRDRDTCALSLQDVAEVLEIGIAAPHRTLA